MHPRCPNCEEKLEELTEITGYHYWMCGNEICTMSYKFYRKAKEIKAQPLDPGAEKLGT